MTVQSLYIAILLFAPLAFGATESWSRLILCTLIYVCAVLFFRSVRRAKRSFVKVPGLIPLLFLLIVMAVQLIPLPPAVVKLISPKTYAVFEETAGLIGPLPWMHISLDVKATIIQLTVFSAYVLFYVLSVQLLSRANFLRRVVDIVVVFGAVIALLAILQHYSAPGKLFWFRETFQSKGFGPFANRNHYAGFMLMLFPIAFCMLVYKTPKLLQSSWREKILEFFNHRDANTYLLLMVAAVVMGTSVFVTLSRGAIICMSLLLFCLALIVAMKANRKKAVVSVVLLGIILVSVGWFGWEPIFNRFNRIRNDEGEISVSRLKAWQDSINIIKDFPVLGTGSGTFFCAHKAYRDTALGRKFYVHAHNDYIEMATDHGIIGLTLFGAFLVAVFRSAKEFRKRTDPYCIYLYIGAVTGVAAVLVHSIVEFNLHIGANAVYFFFMSALSIAAVNTHMHPRRNKTDLARYTKRWIVPTFSIVAVLLLIGGTLINLGSYLGDVHFNNVQDFYASAEMSNADYESIKERSYKATIYDPFASRNYAAWADAEAALSENEAALIHYLKALYMNPLNSSYLQSVAAFYAENGDQAMAEKLHHAALKFESTNPSIHVNYGLWLMKTGAFEDGALAIQKAMILSPNATKYIVRQLSGFGLTYDELIKAFPAMVEPYIELGEYLVAAEQTELADIAFSGAYANLSNEEDVQPRWFRKISQFYVEQSRIAEAHAVIATGVCYLPDDFILHYILGTLYEKLGIFFQAIEEYNASIRLNPKNVSAIRRKDRLMVFDVL